MSANYSKSEKDNDIEMVLVPRIPTKEMIDAAWASALDENAMGVWEDMIQAWLSSKSGKSDRGNG
jgi:hypothetical protein